MNLRFCQNAADINAVAALAKEVWTEHYTPLIGTEQVAYMLERFQSVPAITRAIEQEAACYILAESDAGEPEAYAAFYPEPEGRLFLSKLYVRRDKRGGGLGRALLQAGIAAFPETRTVYLTVNKGNADAIAAYRRLGFDILRAVVNDIGGGFVMDDYVMELCNCPDIPGNKPYDERNEEVMSELNSNPTADTAPGEEDNRQKKWADFVESAVLDFFSDNKLEKLSLEDGNGNKAKLGRTKDNEIKLEYSTTKLL